MYKTDFDHTGRTQFAPTGTTVSSVGADSSSARSIIPTEKTQQLSFITRSGPVFLHLACCARPGEGRNPKIIPAPSGPCFFMYKTDFDHTGRTQFAPTGTTVSSVGADSSSARSIIPTEKIQQLSFITRSSFFMYKKASLVKGRCPEGAEGLWPSYSTRGTI